MKKIFCLVTFCLILFCCTPFKNLPSGPEKIKVVDAYIKSFEIGEIDTLIVRTKDVLIDPYPIPGSDTIKFSIRTAELDIIFLESKDKKISFNNTTKSWGKIKPLQ